MSGEYSEGRLIQDSAGHLLERELGWQVEYAYNSEVLGEGEKAIRIHCKRELI